MATTDVLGIFAHPDDLELQVGGTVLKLNSLGYTVSALDATRGEMGTRGTPEGWAEEAKAAAVVLGLNSRENLDPKGRTYGCRQRVQDSAREGAPQIKAKTDNHSPTRRPASGPRPYCPARTRIRAPLFNEEL